LPALDLSEFNVAGAPGYSKQFFMFGPRDLYRPGETVILNGLLAGDPLFYGIGTRLVAHFGIEQVRIIPGISAVQYLCAQAGIDM
ncbi:SAM-dependent methyltransferase, partial [Salmonella enterica subsp. enterica serovar Virginia]|nr:SAM-dependent methyltransferase [Salmonella enterica subsp. enterica serovar Virginia]